MKPLFKLIAVACCLVAAPFSHAQEAISGEELFKQFGVDLDSVEITVETVASGIHVLYGAGGNIVASVGSQGVLIVDDQFEKLVPKVKAAINDLGGGEIDFVVNTHWHFDHADGNPELAEDGSWIVSQENSRRLMQQQHLINLVSTVVDQPPYPDESLPVITFDDRMQFHFNGEEIDLVHFGPAHTTGDAAVFFHASNVIHMGDVYNAGYPFIDVGNGGDLDGVISFCQSVLEMINQDTIVVPGHGRVGNYASFKEYISMLITIRQRVADLIADGASLEQVIAAKPTAEWDETRGDPTRLLDRAYASLKP
jgi:cyclase